MTIRTIALTLVSLAAFIACADGTQDFIALREQIKQMRVALARQGAYAFVTNCAALNQKAPAIHSKFWVDHLPRESFAQGEYETEKRSLGLDFIGQLEQMSLSVVPVEDVDRLQERADQMLAISSWLNSTSGYGNFILKKWGEGLALTAIGTLAVNPRCETNRVLRLLAAVDGLDADLKSRVAILNEESPHRYEFPKVGTSDEAQDCLECQWRTYHKAAMKFFKANVGRFAGLSCEDVKDSPMEYSFYIIPPRTGDNTVRNRWDYNCHYAVCVCGLSETMSDRIRAIIEFRSLVGDIPKPMPSEIVNYDSGADFRLRVNDIWREKTKRNEPFIAADTILTIYGNLFLDHATDAMRRIKNRNRRECVK